MTVTTQVRAYPFDMHETDVSPLYAQLRCEEPMSRVQLPYGEESWLATRYDDVKQVLTDPRFSRAIAQGLDQPRMRRQSVGDGVMGMDPPDHTRLRKLVGKAFTARRLNQMRSGIRSLAARLLDEMVAKGQPADIVEDFARMVPVTVICDLLGVPIEDRPVFRKWTEGIVGDATMNSDVLYELGAELDGYMQELVAQRRKEPTDDLLGALVFARDNGDKLDDNELIALAGPGLLTGGVETVSSALPSFVFTLLTHPGLFAQLRDNIDIMPTAVEELLRFVPINTAAMFARYATEDIQVGNTLVRTGEPVLAALHAANRDPEVFDNPETIDLTRQTNPHLTFGHGPHHCIGAQLAKMELQESLTELITRFPNLALADAPENIEWSFGVVVRGPVHLHVTW